MQAARAQQPRATPNTNSWQVFRSAAIACFCVELSRRINSQRIFSSSPASPHRWVCKACELAGLADGERQDNATPSKPMQPTARQCNPGCEQRCGVVAIKQRGVVCGCVGWPLGRIHADGPQRRLDPVRCLRLTTCGNRSFRALARPTPQPSTRLDR